jgi:hypothetical protein
MSLGFGFSLSGAEPFEPGERLDGNFIEGGNTGRRF